MNLKEINTRLEELSTQLNENQGRRTEVYSRIVGYYRSVKNWNKGKKEEFGIRKTYQVHCTPAPLGNPEEAKIEDPVVEPVEVKNEEQAMVETTVEDNTEAQVEQDYQKDLFAEPVAEVADEATSADYRFYFRKDCPNCPPMKEFLSGLELTGQHINVDQEEGLQLAVEDNVYQAPTVIVLDDEGKEIFRTDNPAGLEEFLSRKEEVVTA